MLISFFLLKFQSYRPLVYTKKLNLKIRKIFILPVSLWFSDSERILKKVTRERFALEIGNPIGK
jgi:hypothetical protein